MIALHACLKHCHDGVACLAFTGFVDGEDAVFPFFAASLSRQGDFAFDGHSRVFPWAGGAFAALDFVGRDLAAIDRFFPVEENPAFGLAYLRRITLHIPRLPVQLRHVTLQLSRLTLA